MNIEQENRAIQKEYRKAFMILSVAIVGFLGFFGYVLFFVPNLPAQILIGSQVVIFTFILIVDFQRHMRKFIREL